MLKLKMDLSSPNKKRCKIRENDRKFFVVLKYVPSRLRPPHATPCPLGQENGLLSSWNWVSAQVSRRVSTPLTLFGPRPWSMRDPTTFWFKVCSASLWQPCRVVGGQPGTPSTPSSALYLPSHHRNKTEQGLQAGT